MHGSRSYSGSGHKVFIFLVIRENYCLRKEGYSLKTVKLCFISLIYWILIIIDIQIRNEEI